MSISPNLSQAKKALPKGQAVLTVTDVAKRWRVTGRHVIDLIEEGSLGAIDIAGNKATFPMPKAALPKLAARLRVTPEQLLEFLHSFELTSPANRRHFWRVPVETYQQFMEKRHSANIQ